MRKIDTLIIHHSATPKTLDLAKCIASFDRTHKERLHPVANGFGNHIAYHYLIAGNGKVQPTRPEAEIGFHASKYDVNKKSIGICLIGNFDVEKPNPVQLFALRDLIKSIKERYFIKEVSGHRKYAPKTCPGAWLTDKMILEAFKPK